MVAMMIGAASLAVGGLAYAMTRRGSGVALGGGPLSEVTTFEGWGDAFTPLESAATMPGYADVWGQELTWTEAQEIAAQPGPNGKWRGTGDVWRASHATRLAETYGTTPLAVACVMRAAGVDDEDVAAWWGSTAGWDGTYSGGELIPNALGVVGDAVGAFDVSPLIEAVIPGWVDDGSSLVTPLHAAAADPRVAAVLARVITGATGTVPECGG